MASVTVNISNTGWNTGTFGIAWTAPAGERISLGNTLASDPLQTQFWGYLQFGRSSEAGKISIRLAPDQTTSVVAAGPDFTTEMETNGSILFEALDGSSVTVIGITDTSDPYLWLADNAAAVTVFTENLILLADRSLTVTFNDNQGDVAPSFADDTGDAQTWETGTAITAITVPAATGTPTPTYAAEGNLPAGIAFDTATRVISGTPTATGSGTITIRATNSAGTADWTITYATTAPASAPSRPDAATLTVDSDTQITAVGVAPNNGGDTITSYDWRYRITSPLGAWVNRSNVSNLTQVFTGLEPATPYRFQFRATNSIGDSAYSPSANATTDATSTTTTTYEVRVKATASGFTDSEYSDPPETIDVTA